MKIEGFLYWNQFWRHFTRIHARICGVHACMYHICMYVSFTYAWNVSKTEFNTKILLSSWIMHRFQRFLMFWKAECFLFHLETTLPHCFVFLLSKTWHLWKVCFIYWTNAGSSIPVLGLEGYGYGDISANMQYLRKRILESLARV